MVISFDLLTMVSIMSLVFAFNQNILKWSNFVNLGATDKMFWGTKVGIWLHVSVFLLMICGKRFQKLSSTAKYELWRLICVDYHWLLLRQLWKTCSFLDFHKLMEFCFQVGNQGKSIFYVKKQHDIKQCKQL